VIREEDFVQSHGPYAVDLDSLQITGSFDGVGGTWYQCRADAVWFRRRKGLTVACIGELRTSQQPRPADTAEFLERYTDGRYGGDCFGRWDGTRYWGAQEPGIAAAHLALLRPMLERHPAIPAGYDGWWRF